MQIWENETEEQTRIRMALIATPKFAPSSHSPWVGKPVEGSPYTAEQLASLAKAKKDPAKVWWHDVPLFMPDPNDAFGISRHIRIRCPKISQTRDRTRVLVIAPDGVRYWTAA